MFSFEGNLLSWISKNIDTRSGAEAKCYSLATITHSE